MLKKFLIYFYILVCFLSLIADATDNELLLLISKPFIVPIIYFYYFIQSKKINYYFSLAILFFYIGETIIILDYEDNLLQIILFFSISYLLLIKLGLEDLKKFKYNSINVVSLIIILGMMSFIFNSLYEVVISNIEEYKYSIIFYIITIILLSLVAAYKLIYKINLSNLFFVVAITCFIVSDVFYILYNYNLDIFILSFINFAMQMIGYFFLVETMLANEEGLDRKKTIPIES